MRTHDTSTRLEIRICNVIVDYQTFDGQYHYQPHQLVGTPEQLSDSAITDAVKLRLPPGSVMRVLTEIAGNWTLEELVQIADGQLPMPPYRYLYINWSKA